MLRQGRLAEADQLFQLADAFFPGSQLAQDHQPVLVTHGFQKCAGPTRILLKCFKICFHVVCSES
ncbi:hypothetical protein GCM10027256_34510 [Novispirillum itersonii subsp. nipponicum]